MIESTAIRARPAAVCGLMIARQPSLVSVRPAAIPRWSRPTFLPRSAPDVIVACLACAFLDAGEFFWTRAAIQAARPTFDRR
jgi:hypothetical protein